jgi:hypothetical protein
MEVFTMTMVAPAFEKVREQAHRLLQFFVAGEHDSLLVDVDARAYASEHSPDAVGSKLEETEARFLALMDEQWGSLDEWGPAILRRRAARLRVELERVEADLAEFEQRGETAGPGRQRRAATRAARAAAATTRTEARAERDELARTLDDVERRLGVLAKQGRR